MSVNQSSKQNNRLNKYIPNIVWMGSLPSVADLIINKSSGKQITEK